jgi:hypothetical protein
MAGSEQVEELERSVTAEAKTAREPFAVPASTAFASAVGNRSMARLARTAAGSDARPGGSTPHADLLRRAVAIADEGDHREARSLLGQALARVERDPGSVTRIARTEALVGRKCACGGTVLPGGECSKCMASRLARQGMPEEEIQRVVLARTKVGVRQLARKRSFFGCMNANLASMGVAWALIAVVSSVCGVLGAIAGLAGGPAAPATAPSGMAIAAAICVAAVTGATVGAVLGIIEGCWRDTDFTSQAASTASLDTPSIPTGDADQTAEAYA